MKKVKYICDNCGEEYFKEEWIQGPHAWLSKLPYPLFIVCNMEVCEDCYKVAVKDLQVGFFGEIKKNHEELQRLEAEHEKRVGGA